MNKNDHILHEDLPGRWMYEKMAQILEIREKSLKVRHIGLNKLFTVSKKKVFQVPADLVIDDSLFDIFKTEYYQNRY